MATRVTTELAESLVQYAATGRVTTEIAEALVNFPSPVSPTMGQTFTDKLFLGSVATKPAISSVVGVPVVAGNAGDLALSDNGTLYVYDGSAWVATQDALPALTDGQLFIGSTGLPPVAATITSGGGIDVTGGPGSIVLGSTAGGDLSGSVDAATVVGIQGTPVSATAPALNEVLKYDGAQWAPAADVAGSIGGTIAATEIAFGTALDTIGGSANLTWNSGTDALAISDAAVLLTTTATPGAIELDDTGTTNRLVFTIAAGQATVTSTNGAAAAQPLDLITSDLKFAGLSGTPGQVLTVDPLGTAPTWQTPAAATPAGADTQVQFNSGGSAFGASANFTFVTGADTLTISDGAGTETNIAPGSITPATGNNLTIGAAGGSILDLVGSEIYINNQAGSPNEVLTAPASAGNPPTWELAANVAGNLGLAHTLAATPTSADLDTYPLFNATVAGPFNLTNTPTYDGRQITIVNTSGDASTVTNGTVSRTMSADGGQTWVWNLAAARWFCTANV